MNKRTRSSVTEISCQCRFLQNAANDPDLPIILDELTGEFQFKYDERHRSLFKKFSRAIFGHEDTDATLVIYHCPFCGGAAPESKRHLLFEVIPHEEESRLSELLKSIKTIDNAISQLGLPDLDGHLETKTPESDGLPSRIEYHRDIQYHGLSDVAIVRITERADGSAYWQLQGKYKAH